MAICHEHNLASQPHHGGRYGILVTVRGTDPFRNLVGADWRKEHWYETSAERDQALKEMSERYIYYRPGDRSTLKYEKIERK